MAAAVALWAPVAAWAATPERIRVAGELVDTWCYLSGVMGPKEATVGTAHHTCAVWCAAGGIPVGLLADDGTLYMVLKLEGAEAGEGDPRILAIQASRVTAEGSVFRRDGMAYLVVDRVVENQGVVVQSHTEFGVVPGNAIADEVIERIKRQ